MAWTLSPSLVIVSYCSIMFFVPTWLKFVRPSFIKHKKTQILSKWVDAFIPRFELALSRGQKLIKDNIQSPIFSLPECKQIPVISDPKQKKILCFCYFFCFFFFWKFEDINNNFIITLKHFDERVCVYWWINHYLNITREF